MPQIDINADIGEGFAHDDELMTLVSSVNVCMGVHAGSPEFGHQTFLMAISVGCRVGAHVGFPDRASMGRKLPDQVPDDWVESVIDQVTRAADYAYIKPHGALYHWLANEPVKASKVWDALAKVELPFMGMLGTEHDFQCRSKGLHFISEGFCERTYAPNGLLVPRSEPSSMIYDHEVIVSQALRLANEVDSICIHGDRPDCLAVATSVRAALIGHGFEVSP
ncbi:MAG TPA: LamB/YcsF family protein [Fimbriimonas sp.]|nr:LamB/YcsF family protein [Fimbriimonas sp.]